MGRAAYPGRRCACPGLLGATPSGLSSAYQFQLHLPLGGRFLILRVAARLPAFPASCAGEAGLRSGDVILQVNKKEVSGAKELHAALEQEEEHATLLIQRGASTMFLAIERE